LPALRNACAGTFSAAPGGVASGPRIYAKTFQQALDILLKEADTRYDRHAVAVLFALAEGKTGEKWAQEWQHEV
jgi:HD-GYP domain-containing protein (c-di-GMP phosphodiesterase class II)